MLLDGPDGPVSGRATQQRRLALLALVGSAGDRGRSRDQLISLLWPETDPRDARQHLSHSIYALRKSLGEEAVRTAGEYVRLSASDVEVDSLVFESAVDRGERAAAADVYAGPFMDGFFIDGAPEFEHWVDEERRRLAKLYVESLEEAGAEADQAGDYAASIRWWGRLVDQDPYNSATVVKLMQTLWAAGDPANALLAADEHAKRLRLDLGFEPTAEVVDLAASVRGSQRRRPTGKAWDSDPQAPQEGLPSATPAGPKRHTLHWRLAAATAGVIVALVAGWLARRPDNAGSGRPHRSLAVIPFVNLTGEPAAEYLVDGVTDQLIAVLSRVPDLRVPAQTSSFQFKDRALDVRAISDSLGVDHILEGSVGPTDTGFRVTAQLINASTGYHLWTETYERQPARLPGVEEEIARATLEELGVELADSVWPAGGRTRDPAAWQDYARARHWWSKRTPAGTDTALAYFRRAVDSDPGWALAWSGLANAYTTGVFWGHLPSDDSIAAVTRAAAERAVQLDSMLAEAWASYAAVLHDIDGDYEGAAREFGRAIDLNPNYSVARLWYGETLFMKLGRYAEGLREIRAAYAIDPLSPIIVRMLADFLWWSPGGAEEALRYFGLALDLEPGHWPSHSNEAKALACLGRDDEARASLTRLRDLFPDVPRALLDAAGMSSKSWGSTQRPAR